MSNQWNALVAAVDGARRDDLVAAMRAENWHVKVVEDLPEAARLAASGAYHVAVLACRRPDGLPVEPLRGLLRLQADLAVVILAPGPRDAAPSAALAWTTADHVHPLDAPTETLMEVLREEGKDVGSDQAQYTVFCVDDDEEFLASLRAFLPTRLQAAFPRFDLDFEFFADPAEALAEAGGLPPDRLALVVADQIMPRMEGIELLRHIKAIHPDTSGVLLTGHAALDSAVLAINSRVLEKYFFKPVEDSADFAGSLEHLLREHHLLLQAADQRRRLMDQFEFIRMLSVVGSEGKALAAAARFLRERLAMDQVAGALLTDEGLVVRVNVGLAGTMPVGTVLPAGSRVEDVLRSGRLTLVRGEEDLPPTSGLETVARPLAVLPLVWAGRPLGAIVAARSGGRRFTRPERLLLGFLCDVTSVAVGGCHDRHALEEHYVGTMAALMETIEAKDNYTRGHTERVTQIATDLAAAVGIGGSRLQDIRRAATLHDIGKIAVPDAIILKAGRLTEEEFRVVREHPARADRILHPLKHLGNARMIVRGHHERWDGKGYPDGLTAQEIPFGARILALADAYDAMTSTRTYRMAMDPAAALREIERSAASQFDPELTVAFLKMMRGRTPPQPVPSRAQPAMTKGPNR